MLIGFDPEKDRINIAKHGISLGRAADMDIRAFRIDDGFDYGETRYRAFGLIDGRPHCLIFAVRGDTMRAISLRRAHSREYARYVR